MTDWFARPVLHVNWYEAEAYCRWAGRRLPTEAEWEMAASWDANTGRKRRFPWGDAPPGPEHANLDYRAGSTVDVRALPAGDSPVGCRQMIGNVWEWVSDTFAPYPGFVADPYAEYSQPYFANRYAYSWANPTYSYNYSEYRPRYRRSRVRVGIWLR